VPHNDYIELLMRSGIVGLSLYVVLLAYMFFSVLRCHSRSSNALTAQVSGATVGMLLVYVGSSIAGMIFRVLAMSCFAMLVGACMGVCSSHYHPSIDEAKGCDE
jgi:O-antigen ligase